MKFVKLWAFAALSLVACAASQGSNDGAADSNQDLALRSGNIDSAAIVEVGTMMLASQPIDLDLDHYNAQDPFAIQGQQFVATYQQRLAMFDGEDDKTDWTDAQRTAWINKITSGNYQLIDTSKPCDWENPHTYLDIERAQLTGGQYTTCGGRMPNEDALDVTLSLLIKGPAASAQDEDAIRDGVSQATKKSDNAFPYIAEMN